MSFHPRFFPLLALLCLVAVDGLSSPLIAADGRPNVVLIVCDDLNDYITGIPGLTGHPQARSPNVEKLAASGVAFARAYSNHPVCAPSRSSFLTGIYGHSSGNLFWAKWYENEKLANSKTLMEHFRDNGYYVAGTGKLMHHLKEDVWTEYHEAADYGPFPHDGTDFVAHPSVPEPFRSIGPIDGSYGSLESSAFETDGNPETGWAAVGWNKNRMMQLDGPNGRDPTPDERNANWASERLQAFAEDDSEQPFLLAVGFIRPHTPLVVPQKYFDRFPLEDLELPPGLLEGDSDDTHLKDVFTSKAKGLMYYQMLKASYPDIETGLKAFSQAYLASVAAVDDCIGQVVEAIEANGLAENTIIVLTSDHGWNMGQKEFLFKHSPWEGSTRVPFIVRAPGVTQPGGVAQHPIGLIDLYPTLVDLCGLEGDTRKNERGLPLDGYSVRPFLENPEARAWEGPAGALTMIYAPFNSKRGVKGPAKDDPDKQHFALRTERWRYIRYNNGAEELYDHETDPQEYTNLAEDADYAAVKAELFEQMQAMLGGE